jgi:hypothetical protein
MEGKDGYKADQRDRHQPKSASEVEIGQGRTPDYGPTLKPRSSAGNAFGDFKL